MASSKGDPLPNMANDPRIPDHELTAQGLIYRRASTTDEKVPEIAPEFRGRGATPEEKEDESKAWISRDRNCPPRDTAEPSRPGEDTYARELHKRLGLIQPVIDKLEDAIATAKEKVTGATKSVTDDTKNSAAVSTHSLFLNPSCA